MNNKVIDVSTWNTVVDWNAVKASGVWGVMIRSGYGSLTSQKDKKFEAHYAGAKAAGLMVGTYWYSYALSVEGAKAEAKTCLEVIKGKTFELPVAFDLEDPSQYKLGKATLSDMVVAFGSTIESAGYFASLYSNLNWLTNYLDYSKVKRFSIWLAQWTSKPTYSNPFDMWQYSSEGSVSGINGRVDMNECYRDFPTEIKAGGLNGFSKPTSTPTPAPKPTPTKSIDEIAKEVINGKWGNGEDRKNRLTEAGYDYSKVQAKVNELMSSSSTSTPAKKSVDEIAKEVIQGKWGNGTDRKNKLTAAGYDYNAVQNKVNELCGSTSTPKKSIEEVAREVIRGDWGNGSERKDRLTKAGYNYSAVQSKVNELLS